VSAILKSSHTALLKFRNFLRSLARDHAGSSLILFVFFFIPAMSFVGASIDFGRIYIAKTNVQSALDSATMAGIAHDNDNKALAVARDYFDHNHNSTYTVTPSFSVISATSTVKRGITAEASIEVNTLFLQLMGMNTMRAKVVSLAREGKSKNVKILFVLDTTESMGSQDIPDGSGSIFTRHSVLETLVTEIIDSSYDIVGQQRLAIGFIPFTSTVNIGKKLNVSNVRQISGYTNTTPSTANPWGWAGCLMARPTSADLTDDLTMPATAYDINTDTTQVYTPYLAPPIMLSQSAGGGSVHSAGLYQIPELVIFWRTLLENWYDRRLATDITGTNPRQPFSGNSASDYDALYTNYDTLNGALVSNYRTWPTSATNQGRNGNTGGKMYAWSNDISTMSSANYGASPNRYCPPETVLPLWDQNKPSLTNALNTIAGAVRYSGGDLPHLGMAWANRILQTPSVFSGFSATPPQTGTPRNIVIVITDGMSFDTSGDLVNITKNDREFNNNLDSRTTIASHGSFNAYGSSHDPTVTTTTTTNYSGRTVPSYPSSSHKSQQALVRFSKVCNDLKTNSSTPAELFLVYISPTVLAGEHQTRGQACTTTGNHFNNITDTTSLTTARDKIVERLRPSPYLER